MARKAHHYTKEEFERYQTRKELKRQAIALKQHSDNQRRNAFSRRMRRGIAETEMIIHGDIEDAIIESANQIIVWHETNK